MSRRTTVALCALGIALTGCGAGRGAEVLKEHTSIDGLNVDLQNGNIQVRNVFATPTANGLTQVAAGGTLTLHFHVYNRTGQPDLMVASAPVELAGPGVVAGAVAIGPRNSVTVGGPSGGVTATIAAVAQPVWVGTYIPLTLSFATAGHVDLTVPVEDAAVAQS